MRVGRDRRTFVSVTLALALLLGSAPGEAREVRGGGQTVRIRIVDNRFRGGTITVDRGTRVKWVNVGSDFHTSTSTTGVWDSGILQPGDGFRRRFAQAGTFPYFCENHPTMRGTITVT